jgi:hypothetical protein
MAASMVNTWRQPGQQKRRVVPAVTRGKSPQVHGRPQRSQGTGCVVMSFGGEALDAP